MHSVPQGSISGSLLFLCYVKGMPTLVNHDLRIYLRLYADDANLNISDKTMKEIEWLGNYNLMGIQHFC